MGKYELAKELAKKCNLSNKRALEVLNEAIKIIEDRIFKGEQVIIKGFGSFKLRVRDKEVTYGNKVGKPCKYIKFKAHKRVEL